MAFLESFLVSLSMAVLKWAATKAGLETLEYVAELKAMEENKKKADAYKAGLKKGSTREERKQNEDNLLG